MSEQTTRAPDRQAVERRRQRAIARPYARDVMKWQTQLAFYRHSGQSRRATDRDAAVAGVGLQVLLVEVQNAQAQFHLTAMGEPMVERSKTCHDRSSD